MIGLILIFLILALATGILSFGGFLVGTSFLVFAQILFPIFMILFVVSIIRHLFFPPM